MNFDNPMVQTVIGYAMQGWDLAFGWLTSLAAWSQFGLLLLAFGAAYYITRYLSPLAKKLLTPPEEQSNIIATARRFVLLFLPLLLPLLAYLFTGLGEQVTRSLFGSGAVIAFGKRVFIFLAARILVDKITYDPFLKLLGKYILVPAAALFALGALDPIIAWLGNSVVSLGNISFSALAILRGLVFGSILFWLGRWSNEHSSSYIKNQKEMRPAIRELTSKAVELVIFGAVFLMLMNIMGVNLTSLAVLGGAIGVGLGLGLQKIASNFIAGLILLASFA